MRAFGATLLCGQQQATLRLSLSWHRRGAGRSTRRRGSPPPEPGQEPSWTSAGFRPPYRHPRHRSGGAKASAETFGRGRPLHGGSRGSGKSGAGHGVWPIFSPETVGGLCPGKAWTMKAPRLAPILVSRIVARERLRKSPLACAPRTSVVPLTLDFLWLLSSSHRRDLRGPGVLLRGAKRPVFFGGGARRPAPRAARLPCRFRSRIAPAAAHQGVRPLHEQAVVVRVLVADMSDHGELRAPGD